MLKRREIFLFSGHSGINRERKNFFFFCRFVGMHAACPYLGML